MAVQKKTAGKRKKITTSVEKGIVHVHSSFNNTLVTITDVAGNVIAWSSAGSLGYKGNKKSTPFAASQAAETAANAAKEYGADKNILVGANIAGFMKVATAMMAQGIV